MKYVSFSLWGSDPLYNIGAIKNASLCQLIYHDWKMVLYYDKTVPYETIEKLKKHNVEVIDMSDSKIYGCFWRFLISDREDCEYAIFRDCDSRVTLRERLAVDEWIKSNKSFHVMRDHPYHRIPFGNDTLGILAGMWGIIGKTFNVGKSVSDFLNEKTNYYGIDQSFLKTVYDRFENDRFVHDEFFSGNPFPIKREPGYFVGGRIGIDDKPLGEDYKLVNY
jgi:hypothetical protein